MADSQSIKSRIGGSKLAGMTKKELKKLLDAALADLQNLQSSVNNCVADLANVQIVLNNLGSAVTNIDVNCSNATVNYNAVTLKASAAVTLTLTS